MTDEPRDLEAVQRQLQEIQSRRRSRIRWHISKHTAEMAIEAIESSRKPAGRSGKPRRRKKTKRLL